MRLTDGHRYELSIQDPPYNVRLPAGTAGGYGTGKNWMAVRQELLYYTRGTPPFEVQYTDITSLLRGYYKTVGGERTENGARNRSPFIRPGNVWVDLQQVFYRLEENVPGGIRTETA